MISGTLIPEEFWARTSFIEIRKGTRERGHEWLGAGDFLVRPVGPVF